MLDRSGQQIGNYRIIRSLGQGGFATVYLGEHVYLKTEAAIKLLGMRMPERDFQNFLKEAQTIARLKHPHIIRVLEFNIEAHNTQPFLVMEYAPRGSLLQLHPRRSVLSLETIIPYVKQVANALQYAHDQRVVHRDVKPANMLVASPDTIVLSDFGIAVAAHSSQSLSSQNIVGTTLYMAPEQSMGDACPASDQYSLGCVIYEWLCGVCPFEKDTPLAIIMGHLMESPPPLRERRPSISPLVEQVVLKALAKKPQERFASIIEFAQTLEEAHQQSKRPLLRRAQFIPLAFKEPSPEPVLSPYATQYQHSAAAPAPDKPPTTIQPFPHIAQREQLARALEFARKPASQLPSPQISLPMQQLQVKPDHLRRLLSGNYSPWSVSLRRAPLVWACSLFLVMLLTGSLTMWLSNTHTGGTTPPAINSTLAYAGEATSPPSNKAVPAPYGTKGSLVLDDSLATVSAHSKWDVNTNSNKAAGCRFEGSVYIIEQQSQNYCLAENTNYTDFVYQIDMKIDWGGTVGILFRAQDEQQRYYDFQIGTDGSYALYRSDSATADDKLIKMGSSPAIHQGYHQYNMLAVKAIGENIFLYCNLTLLAEIHDPTPAHTLGSIGVGTHGQDDTEATFRNAKVWQI